MIIRLTREEEEGSFQRILKKTREGIAMKDLGIKEVKARRTLGGNMLIEVSGEGSGRKAEKLSEKLNEVLAGDATAKKRIGMLKSILEALICR